MLHVEAGRTSLRLDIFFSFTAEDMMTTDSLTPRPPAGSTSTTEVRRVNPTLQAIRDNWFYRYIIFPIGQILVFVIGAALLLTVIAYAVALIFPVPDPDRDIFLANQISKQLPGMIISGIGIGFVYAMIALGYTLVYGVLKFINFAHSEIFMVGSVAGYVLTNLLASSGAIGEISPFVLIPAMVLTAMLVSGTLAVVIERVAYRPLRGAPRLVPLITAIGLSFVLIDATRALLAISGQPFNMTYPTRELPYLGSPIALTFNGPVVGGFNIGGTSYGQITADGTVLDEWQVEDVTYSTITVGGVTVGGESVKIRDIRSGETEYESVLVNNTDLDVIEDGANNVNVRVTVVIIVVAATIMLVLLNYFVNGTKIGRGIRAVSQDQATAGLMGINVNLMIAITFFIGGAFGGGAGALFGLNAGTVTPYVGFIPGLKAFTAAVLGGIGNVTGALLGGLMLGMVESFLNGTLAYFPALGQRYTDIFTFSVLILILIFRPNGLLGERVDEKV
ncbi:MAG: branched-chain amino acid ABC transporter permease [Chloroflexota bacterium]|nr:branched-chain amino acid ABC transporter permease [Chloroflexota bacterium]